MMGGHDQVAVDPGLGHKHRHPRRLDIAWQQDPVPGEFDQKHNAVGIITATNPSPGWMQDLHPYSAASRQAIT
jgi:hypothetical protein